MRNRMRSVEACAPSGEVSASRLASSDAPTFFRRCSCAAAFGLLSVAASAQLETRCLMFHGDVRVNPGLGELAAVLLSALLAACGSSDNETVVVPAGAPTAEALAEGPGAVPSPLPPIAGLSTLKDQISALERHGAVPALDRSRDIAGPDLNQNGVRDDIEAWINARPLDEGQRKALMQKARALQMTLLIDLKDRAALDRSGDRLMASTKCAGDRFSPRSESYGFTGKIEAMTANTRERAARYAQYNAARSGSSTTYPSGDTCEP